MEFIYFGISFYVPQKPNSGLGFQITYTQPVGLLPTGDQSVALTNTHDQHKKQTSMTRYLSNQAASRLRLWRHDNRERLSES